MGILDCLKPKKETVTTPTKKTTKRQQVLSHLRKHGSIDSWTAIELYGATRLSAIIFTFRQKGFNIESIDCSALDRNSDVSNYTTYKLIS
jgi:hypothetical protein